MLSVLCVAVSLIAAPSAQSLAAAYKSGKVDVQGGSFAGHTIASLHVQNLSGGELVVDLNGSYLVPSDDGLQPLGLGLVTAGSGQTSLDLKPGAVADLKVLCVCMAEDKGSPDCASEYRLATKLAPEPILRILRKWKIYPWLPHSAVQLAAWGYPASIQSTPKPIRATVDLLPTVQRYASCGGELFALSADGSLFRANSWRSPLERLDLHCMDLRNDGRIFAIREAPVQGYGGKLKLRVSELDTKTGGWADRIEAVPGKLLWVSEDGSAAMVRSLRGEIVRIDSAGQKTLFERPIFVCVTPQGCTYWVPGDHPSQILKLERKGGPESVYHHDAKILSIASPGESPYLLDERGRLYFLGDKSSTRIAKKVISIEAMGRRLLAITESSSHEGRHVPGRVVLFRDATPDMVLDHPRHLPLHYLVDARTGVLLSIDHAFTVRRYDSDWKVWSIVSRLTDTRDPEAVAEASASRGRGRTPPGMQ